MDFGIYTPLIAFFGVKYGFRALKNAYKSYVAKSMVEFSPKEISRISETYTDILNIREEFPAAKAFNKYVTGRIGTVDRFSNVRATNGKSFAENIKADTNAAKVVKKNVEEVLALSQKTQESTQDYVDAIAHLNTYTKNPPKNYSAYGMLARLEQIKNNARHVMIQQYNSDIEKIDDLFNTKAPKTAPFMKSLLISQGIDSLSPADQDRHVEQLKQEIKHEIKTAHDTEIKAFEKTINGPIKTVSDEISKENSRVIFLATLYEHNKAVRKAIDNLAEQNKKTAFAKISCEFNDENPKKTRALFKNIRIDDLAGLEVLQTVSGRKLKRESDGSFSMQLPHPLFSPFYYGKWNNRYQSDLLCLAMAVKAAGFPGIEMTINYQDSDPEKAKKKSFERARDAYEACRKAGFEPKNIALVINGETYSGDKLRAELFKHSSGRYDKIESRAVDMKKAVENSTKKLTNDFAANEMKHEMQAIRLSNAAAAGDSATPRSHI